MTSEFKPARRTDARQAGAYVPLSSGATPGIRRESRGDDCRIPQPAPNRCRSDSVRLYAVCRGGRWCTSSCARSTAGRAIGDQSGLHSRRAAPRCRCDPSCARAPESSLCRIVLQIGLFSKAVMDSRAIKSVRQGLPAVAYIRAGERPTAVAERPSRARRARRRAGRLLLHPPPRTGLRPSRLADARRRVPARCHPPRPAGGVGGGRHSRWLALAACSAPMERSPLSRSPTNLT